MTTVEALKELFTALGGSEEDVKEITTNPGMVHALAGIASDAIELPKVTAADAGDILAVDESGKWAKTEPESGLPEVSASDNGNILAVVEGAWAKSAPSGGVKYYTATVLSGSDHRVKLDNNVQYQTLVDFYHSGGMPVIIITTSDYKMHLFPQKQIGDDITFLGIFNDDSSGTTWKIMQIMIRSTSIGDNERASSIRTITTS
jgi:hypothetical protein